MNIIIYYTEKPSASIKKSIIYVFICVALNMMQSPTSTPCVMQRVTHPPTSSAHTHTSTSVPGVCVCAFVFIRLMQMCNYPAHSLPPIIQSHSHMVNTTGAMKGSGTEEGWSGESWQGRWRGRKREERLVERGLMVKWHRRIREKREEKGWLRTNKRLNLMASLHLKRLQPLRKSSSNQFIQFMHLGTETNLRLI